MHLKEEGEGCTRKRRGGMHLILDGEGCTRKRRERDDLPSFLSRRRE